MKIAFIISTFPPCIGGMGQVALAEALALTRLGHEVTVFTLDYGLKLSDCSFKIHHLSPWVRWGDAGFVPQLFFKLRGFDLAHLHFPFYGGSFIVFLANLFFGLPYVVTYHMDAQPQGLGKNFIKICSDWLVSSRILKRAKKVILVDQDTQQFSLVKKINNDNLVKISNTVDTEIFSKKIVSATDLGLPDFDKKNILLFVGNLLPIKRLDLIFEALHKLSDPNLVLIVVGGGYGQANYQALIKKLSLEKSVYFVQSVKDPRILVKYYSLAAVTVIPSDYESFSLVALESLACGTPVIASRLSALQNKIDPAVNGFLFIPGDSQDLADKIKDFFNFSRERREQFGQNGREGVVGKFSMQKHLEDLLKVYQSVV
ncbi:MAG: glycosyltransferase family 4 protein [Candidatus Magasanikbacteria bacterium]|nr:glycosyltransferase family 4 protein [Candidatus Magasanikbacteria bacterium]